MKPWTPVIPDVHAPFHCRTSTRKLLATLDQHKRKIGRVVLLGDTFDCHALSTHRREPQWEDQLAKELASGKRWLTKLREVLPKAEIICIEGNHERRWASQIQGRLPMMRQLGISLPRHLELERDLGIQWWDCKEKGPVKVSCGQGKLVHCWHGDEFKGGSRSPAGHALKIARQTGQNTHIGHTHSWGQARTFHAGKELFAMEGGFMGNRKSAGFRYAGPEPQWPKPAYHIYDAEATDSPLGKAYFPIR